MMIITEEINYIFALVKQIKKPLVKIFPDGRVIGTDESFASLNIITNNSDNNIDEVTKQVYNLYMGK